MEGRKKVWTLREISTGDPSLGTLEHGAGEAVAASNFQERDTVVNGASRVSSLRSAREEADDKYIDT